jgi:type IV pilus assembly protein PilB
MTEENCRLLEKALLKKGLVGRDDLVRLIRTSRGRGERVSRLLLENRLISEEQLMQIFVAELGIRTVNPFDYPLNKKLINELTADLVHCHRVMPLARNNGRIILAMSDPLDREAIDRVALVTGAEIIPVVAPDSAIRQLITRFYPLNDHSSDVALIPDRAINSQDLFINQGADPAPAPQVIQMVNSLIEQAIEEQASDIHLEPDGDDLRIRMRLDGILHDLAAPPGQLRSNIISRVKLMANLDIAERRLPQDGNINWKDGQAGINLRVSTMPTINGEKVVIRLLEKERIVLPLDQLGFSAANYRLLQRLLLNQYGLLLVTGPTGCGKTTTLYSAIHHLNQPQDNIITVEDPVEYRLKGVNQVQVNRKINRTFANALRSILRQDPNIIMVGEIRDLETAKITTQAALTGHLVLSTLHTNNAAGAITRLIDMGLENYLVTASLLGVIAQRLVRQICPACAGEYVLSEREKVFFERYFGQEPPSKLIRGAKCHGCNQTGYRGRLSIQEILIVNRELQELIISGATAEVIHNKAVEQGMFSLVKDGMRLILEGKTTVSEIVRSTFNTIIDQESALNEESIAYLSNLKHRED